MLFEVLLSLVLEGIGGFLLGFVIFIVRGRLWVLFVGFLVFLVLGGGLEDFL